MKLVRVLLSLAVLAGVVGVAYVGQTEEPAGARMADAAEKFLASLTPDQKTQAAFPYDSPERTRWFFTPQQDKDRRATRKGAPLSSLTTEQRAAALNLLRAGTSTPGFTKATNIMSLEGILADLEKGGAMVRKPGWYFFSVFGTPSRTGPWGWRVEGHHLALNFTLDGGRVVAATPAFFGANPARWLDGPHKGQSVLPEAEDYARDLFKSLDAEQAKTAHVKDHFPEIQENTKAPKVGEPVGLPATKMTDAQQAMLVKLLEGYAGRMPPDIAENELGAVKRAGIEKVHFAFSGGTEPGQPHTYRVQGPTFVVEFLNVQADSAKNPANHIHSAWRSLHNDFGLAAR